MKKDIYPILILSIGITVFFILIFIIMGLPAQTYTPSLRLNIEPVREVVSKDIDIVEWDREVREITLIQSDVWHTLYCDDADMEKFVERHGNYDVDYIYNHTPENKYIELTDKFWREEAHWCKQYAKANKEVWRELPE